MLFFLNLFAVWREVCIFAPVMKIVVDDKIPYIRETLGLVADELVALRGTEITADDVRDADVLVVRTRTRCDERLLSGSKVQLVVTATIGFDHIDTAYMQRAGIAWTNCPGCNAASVAQYVECALLLLERKQDFRQEKFVDTNERFCLQGATIGIVGCGHVGSKVKAVGERLGMRVLVCDPLLEQTISHHPSSNTFVSMDVIEREADVITFHVPLTMEGPFATWHMADDDFFHRLSRVPYIINTSRGEVVDNQALLGALEEGRVCDAVIDVWEHEPDLNRRLLERVFIGTPHIAGYSADGKANADNMVVDAICQHFSLSRPALIMPPSLPKDFSYTGNALELYNPLVDSQQLKKCPENFEKLRNNYPLRREQYDK